jgi:PRTase ComF-like
MSFSSFSLHKINSASDLSFSAEAYSRFKFGDEAEAENFGTALARSFIETHKNLLTDETQTVAVPSPYDFIPTASCAMTKYFVREINRFLAASGKASLLESRIHRYKTYSIDYGNLSFEERFNLITQGTYHIDKIFLSNRNVLLLDDIRITGSHELVLKQQIEQLDIKGNFMFLYFAELVNTAIAPEFENVLNYSEVKDVRSLLELIREKIFTFNTRVIKFILSSSSGELQLLLENVEPEFLHQLCDLAYGNNYHLMNEYKTNLITIQQHIHTHHGY